MGFAAGQLDNMRPDAGRFAAQPRHRPATGEFVTGSHLRYHQARAKRGGEASEGGIGNAGHRRQKNPIGDSNVTYFQYLTA
jgi:hypothetical protein